MRQWLALCGVIIAVAAQTAYAFELPEAAVLRDPDYTSGIILFDPTLLQSYNLERYIIDGRVAVLEESAIPRLLSSGHSVMKDIQLSYYGGTGAAGQIGMVTGATAAHSAYNATGRGVTIAVVDSGVDFSNPDMWHAVARDRNNHPIMLDPDGQGLVITNATFYASIERDGAIRNTGAIPEGFTSKVYVSEDGVYLDIVQDGSGTIIQVYNSLFPAVGPSPVLNGTLSKDMKIGHSSHDYIRSQSGVYHLGAALLGMPYDEGPLVQVVPILVVDANEPGVYDTIIPDMSTSWEDYTRFDLPGGAQPDYDFDFTDETPIVLGSGNELLVYDADGDGRLDYSAGTVGARVLDIYGAFSDVDHLEGYALGATNVTLLEPLDVGGDYLGVMFDMSGHGTAVAGVIASKGAESYDIYNGSARYTIPGVAPDAEILPIRVLWYGGIEYAWLWAAGMDNDVDGWEYSGRPRAEIITNSWGVSTFPVLEEVPGYDEIALLANALATPGSIHDNYPGAVMVASSGNSGHGYGSLGTPGAASLAISVGATTNSAYVGTPSLLGHPRFGNSSIHYGHVVDFSSRGPGMIGDARPDLTSVGAYAFAPASVTRHTKEPQGEPFSLFGGTSMAAPLVAGAGAIVTEQMLRHDILYNPFEIKKILMSTASDMGNDPMVQGAGMVDAASAAAYLEGKEGVFAVSNDASYLTLRGVTGPALSSLNLTELGLDRLAMPPKPHPMTSWFAGHLEPGQRSSATFTISNPTDRPMQVRIDPETINLVESGYTDRTTIPRQQDPVMNETGRYAPNYIMLSDVRSPETLPEIFAPYDMPESSLLVLNVNFDFDRFLNQTAEFYADDLTIASLYLYDWHDADGDGEVTAGELAMVSRAGTWGTVQELRVSDPNEVFTGVPVVGVYPVPIRASYWLGITDNNSTAMDYTLTASYYDREPWRVVWLESRDIVVPPNSESHVRATITVPADYQSGIYQGFLTFKGQEHTVNAPLSFAVVRPAGADVVLASGGDHPGTLYEPGVVRGSFDMSSRYTAGEWRHHYVEVPEGVGSGILEISWQSNYTNIGVFVTDPSGAIVQTNMNPGVFGQFAGWPSVDWLGSGPLGEGAGGFYPVKNWNDTTTLIQFPTEEPGTYSILSHTTLFGGESITEPITVKVRFQLP